ncbi:MAG TPA: MgtC/SapB family protein [Methylomirabilota bacterium]|nr:MgtC/SapB family protein [Methylomirabilota bacterium]
MPGSTAAPSSSVPPRSSSPSASGHPGGWRHSCRCPSRVDERCRADRAPGPPGGGPGLHHLHAGLHSFRVFPALHPGRLVAVDTSRIAAWVVTGVGFLGGGAILRTRLSVQGLTTAAALPSHQGPGRHGADPGGHPGAARPPRDHGGVGGMRQAGGRGTGAGGLPYPGDLEHRGGSAGHPGEPAGGTPRQDRAWFPGRPSGAERR